MNEITKKSMQILELPKVLERLATYAVSQRGAELCRELAPAMDAEQAELWLEETTAAFRLSAQRGSPSFSGISDITGAVARADRGGLLSLRELLAVAALLRGAESALNYSKGEKIRMDTCLDVYFDRLVTNTYFAEKLERAIANEEQLADCASAELSDLRRQIRAQEQKVRELLQHMVTTQSKFLQDPIITQRGGRYCVPVRSEHKGDVPGIVHDTSASGATLFIEPMSVVVANNKVSELQGKAAREEERIIASLSAETASFAEGILCDYETLSRLDMIYAKARFAYALDAVRPVLDPTGRTDLRRARHPLLAKERVVPIDVAVGGDYDTLIITGPNTGGKTVSLKTLGLFAAMAACGLYIPAREGSSVGFFTSVCADIGDEQSIEQSLSTFSSHMKNIVDILSAPLENTLILFDELGAGTDPAEGAALAIAIIEAARKGGAKVAATTHYAELKMYALRTPGVMNAACEFDVETLRPTYRLVTGVPGRSNAFAIAARLGLPQEIIDDAGERVSSENKYFEEVVEGLIAERQGLEKERQSAERENRDLAAQNEKMAAEAETARRVREKLQEQAEREAARILADARARANTALAEVEALRKEMEQAGLDERLAAARAKARQSVSELEHRPKRMTEPVLTDFPKGQPPKVGDTVELPRHGVVGTVTAIGEDGKVVVSAGVMKLTVDQTELRRTKLKKEKASGVSVTGAIHSAKARAKPELDLRGMMVDDALIELDAYLDCVARAKLTQVTIIHGKGTGALRDAVRDRLKSCRQVKTFRSGVYGEGDTGVTVVEMA